MKKPTIEHNLRFARQVLTNAVASQLIKEAVTQFGYDEKRLQEGEMLYKKANNLYMDQIKEHGEKIGATEDVRNAYEKASKVYMNHVKIARIACRDDLDLYVGLKLKGSRHKSYTKWFAQANAFYTFALTNRDVQNAMSYLGIDKQKLKEGHNLLKEFEAALHQRGVEEGDVQKATLMRDEAVEELNQWISDFLVITRIALEDDSQELEKLGVVVAS